MKRQNVRTLALVVCTFTYLLLGASVFDILESSMEDTERLRLKEQEKAWMDKYNITQDDFEKITLLGIQLKPYRAGTQWKFAGAFYFATTVITTIGYGHCTPKTVGGKIFCMLYALPGIPLCIVMFQSIGERINTLITVLLRRLKAFLRCKNRSVSQSNLIFVSANVGTIVLTVGAAIFAQYERWDYLDAFYYCFITLTTIGFGDFVALQREDSLAKRPDYVAFSLIFILFGLTVASSVMNLLVLRFLTMNTDDQRRDELEAAAQAQELRRLHGDVIHSVIGVTNHLLSKGDANIQEKNTCPHLRLGNERRNNFPATERLQYRDTSRTLLQPDNETSERAFCSCFSRYFNSLIHCLSGDRDSPIETPIPMTEERATTSITYSESETFDGDYSPWISRRKCRPKGELSQASRETSNFFQFNDTTLVQTYSSRNRLSMNRRPVKLKVSRPVPSILLLPSTVNSSLIHLNNNNNNSNANNCRHDCQVNHFNYNPDNPNETSNFYSCSRERSITDDGDSLCESPFQLTVGGGGIDDVAQFRSKSLHLRPSSSGYFTRSPSQQCAKKKKTKTDHSAARFELFSFSTDELSKMRYISSDRASV